ncbi:MAG: riboflavin biosynthesis protein RibF [Anaerotruncus sp.]|jgi:riboflavin kinase/FMN adenylyltransferase|nr:riboflavin biosynthesis protein RibF [Anaerotruncus sp.]
MRMQIYHSVADCQPCGRGAVALGFFDGLHIGHAAVVSRTLSYQQEGLCPCVFTFTMDGGHPAAKSTANALTTERQKEQLLENWGVRLVLCPDFSEFHAMEPESFVDEILVRRLNANAACCGEDFRFGKKAAGDVGQLAALCQARGIRLDVVPPVTFEGERVSSTRIRSLLGEGRVADANRMLGRAFGYDFTVVRGKQLGRKLDSPTINQRLPDGFVPLRHGVYASVSFAGGAWHPSVTNIGLRPTVEDTTAVNSETYICGFSGDLYGASVEVRLLAFLRPEQRFPSVEALRARIHADAEASVPIAEEYLAGIAGKTAGR